MRLIIKDILREYIEENGLSKLNEGSKRTKLHPRTLSDLNYVVDKVWSAYEKRDDDQPLKGEITVVEPDGGYAQVPVYYLSDFGSQGAVFNIDKDKPRNLYNIMMVVNPDESLTPNKKSLYNLMYHELQHMMDLHSTTFLTTKQMSKYDPNVPEKYWGHDFEFRAYANEILEGIVNEYTDLIGKYTDEELMNSLKSVLNYFGKGGQMDDIGGEVFYNISSEDSEEGQLPHALQVLYLLKTHNPQNWNRFLKMLLSTVEEIVGKIKSQKMETTEGFRKPRKWSSSYCKSTPCSKMGFSQKASCRPYKNCYK
jgi:hypothetical protein